MIDHPYFFSPEGPHIHYFGSDPEVAGDKSTNHPKTIEEHYIILLLYKQAYGFPLTDAEQACIAYSPYGTASSCASCGNR